MTYVFLNPMTAGPGIRRERRTAEIFCVEPRRGQARKRGAADLGHAEPSALAPHFIFYLSDGTPGIPDAAIIYEGIMNGQLSLHYAHWQYLSNRNFPTAPSSAWPT